MLRQLRVRAHTAGQGQGRAVAATSGRVLTRFLAPLLQLQLCALSTEHGGMASAEQHYRRDGVRITHDPHAPGMAEQYGKPGQVRSGSPFARGATPATAAAAAAAAPSSADVPLTCRRSVERRASRTSGDG